MLSIDWGPFWLTLELSLWTVIILLVIGIPLSYWLAFTKSKLSIVVEALATLPLVLPPTVLGFYLLLLFNKQGLVGWVWYRLFDKPLIFHFEGIVLASVIYSLPMMVHPLTASFKAVPKSLIEASYTLGKGGFTPFLKLYFPTQRLEFLRV